MNERDKAFHYSVCGALSVCGLMIALTAMAMYCTGCASWQSTTRKTLLGVHDANDAAWKIGRPAYQDKCMKLALACNHAADSVCEPLVECQKSRRTFVKILNSLDSAIVAGITAIEYGDEDIAKKWVAVSLKLLSEVVEHLKLLGVMK